MNRVVSRVVFYRVTASKFRVRGVNFHPLNAKRFSTFFLSSPLTLIQPRFRSFHTGEVPDFSFLRESEFTQSQIGELYNSNLFDQALSFFKWSPSLETALNFWDLIKSKNKSDYHTSLKESMKIYNVLVESKTPLNHESYVKLMSLANLVTPTTTFDLFIDATKNNVTLNQPLFHQITVAIAKTKNTQIAQNIISMLFNLDFVPFETDFSNLLIVALHPKDAFTVMNFMLEKGLLTNRFIFIRLIDICLNSDFDQQKLPDIEKIQSALNQTELRKDDSLLNHFIQVYFKLGSTKNALNVFDQVQAPTIAMFSKFLDEFINTKEFEKVIEVYDKMIENNITLTEITFVNILTAISHLGPKVLEKGKQIHQQIIQHQLDSNLILINSLIQMYNKCGEPNKSIEVYDKMIENNITPDEITFINILTAISNIGPNTLEKGKQIHQRIPQHQLDTNTRLKVALDKMYEKCDK